MVQAYAGIIILLEKKDILCKFYNILVFLRENYGSRRFKWR